MIGMPSSTARSARRAQRDIEEGGGIKICCCRVFTCVNLNLLSTNHGLLKVSEVILGSCCQTLLVRFGLDSAADIGQAFNTCLTTVSSCLMTSSLLLFCYLLSTRTFNLVRQSLFVSFFLFFFFNSSENVHFILKQYLHFNPRILFLFISMFQEIFFNLCACFMYLSASLYMGFTVSFWLYPKFELQRAYVAYPAMTAVYVSTCVFFAYIVRVFSIGLFQRISNLFSSLQYIGIILGIIHGIDCYLAYKFYKGYL